MEHVYDMIIIGGGPAGYTAALYACRGGLDTVVLEKMSAGGQMALTHQIDNYPGFDEGIDGFTLGMKMQKGAERFGAKTIHGEALSVELTKEIKTIRTAKEIFSARTVVIATGANPRKLELAGETEFFGRGIHYCAACDGRFYKDKVVMVVGGGNAAASDALLLSRICKKVFLIHRRDTLRAEKVYHAPLMQAPNVEFLWNHTVSALLYDEKLHGAQLRNVQTGEEQDVLCDGIFVSIGRTPATEFLKGQLSMDDSGYILTDECTRTNLPGVFAAGDVRQKSLHQIITAAADGAVAAISAERADIAMMFSAARKDVR